MSPPPLTRRAALTLTAALALALWPADPGATAQPATQPATQQADQLLDNQAFLALLSPQRRVYDDAIRRIAADWDDRYTVMLLEAARYLGWRDRGRMQNVRRLVSQKTGVPLGPNFDNVYQWVWRTNPGVHPDYARFKAELYARIDPRFAAYFDDHTEHATIRLDEVRWGGVRRDGIPPLKNPDMIRADQARYLDDGNVVFGIEINGDARAYPKRILAWHEMFKDTVGGVSVNGVYCTLCGAMILYQTHADGVHHELGTSGFLYRSNKLMYDHATESLWSTITGEPVIGPLVGRGVRLEPLSVVTTTWGQWKKQHPDTTVLSPNTGHRRDYSEGAAYREYFVTDELMFTVPELDRRLRNKAEVLALRFNPDAPPTAIAADFLAGRPVYHGALGEARYVVLTDPTGANRVYESTDTTFAAYDGLTQAVDDRGRAWAVTEDALTAPDGSTLRRLPAHRAFWFGWRAAHPDTRLIH